MRFSTSPPTNANSSAAASDSVSAPPAPARRRGRVRACTGFGPAATAPTSGTSSVDRAHRRAAAREAGPRREHACDLREIRARAGWPPAASTRTCRCCRARTSACRKARCAPSWYGKKWTRGRVAAPAGAVSVSTTFGPSPLAVTSQPGTLARQRVPVAAIALPHCGYGSARSRDRELEARAPPLPGCTSRGTRAIRPCALSVTLPERRVRAAPDVGQQQDLAFVAVVDERPGGQRMRRRPLDRAGGHARRQASRRSSSAARDRPGSASTCASRPPS